jgi:hypothetical protein
MKISLKSDEFDSKNAHLNEFIFPKMPRRFMGWYVSIHSKKARSFM